MSKNKSFFEELADIYLLYKLRYFIGAAVIAFIVICIIVIPKMDSEYQKYGYDSYTDNIKHDNWTGEIIPKQEIDTYSNDNKYIINSKGEQVTFGQMKDLIRQFGEI